MQKSTYRSKIKKILKMNRGCKEKQQVPLFVAKLSQSKEDQRDFREFLEIIGMPDLNKYVEFLLKVQELERAEVGTRVGTNEEKIVGIYNQYLRPYAPEKLQMDWATKAKVDTRIRCKPLNRHIFDEAAAKCAAKIQKTLFHFYARSE